MTVVYDLDPAGTNSHVNRMDPHGRSPGIPISTPSRDPAAADLPSWRPTARSTLVKWGVKRV
jgi:hypothetical protein